jgi:hypothetical protein
MPPRTALPRRLTSILLAALLALVVGGCGPNALDNLRPSTDDSTWAKGGPAQAVGPGGVTAQAGRSGGRGHDSGDHGGSGGGGSSGSSGGGGGSGGGAKPASVPSRPDRTSTSGSTSPATRNTCVQTYHSWLTGETFRIDYCTVPDACANAHVPGPGTECCPPGAVAAYETGDNPDDGNSSQDSTKGKHHNGSGQGDSNSQDATAAQANNGCPDTASAANESPQSGTSTTSTDSNGDG